MGNLIEVFHVEMKGHSEDDRFTFPVTHHSMFRIAILEEEEEDTIEVKETTTKTYRLVLWRGCSQKELGSVSFPSEAEADREFDRVVEAIQDPTTSSYTHNKHYTLLP